jgi:hypothetical protein
VVAESRVTLQEAADQARREWAKVFGTPDEMPCTQPSSELADDGQFPSNKALKQINLDLDRTFYTHKDFMEKGGVGQTKLYHILAVYAGTINRDVGYCQGMAFVAAVLLMNMEEEDAFWALVAVMENQKYLEGYYSQNLARVQVDAEVFSKLVCAVEPALGVHLETMGIHPLMYVTPWFMCVFTSLPCWDAVMSVWDLLLFRGVKTIMRVGLAIMQSCKDELLAMTSLGQVLPFLQHLPPSKMTQDALMAAVWRIDESALMIDLAKLEQENVAQVTPQRGQRGSKRTRASENKAQQNSSKRARADGAADGPPPTPSVFRRFMNSLATPLRQRARNDGAETPAPRMKPLLQSNQKVPRSSTTRRSSVASEMKASATKGSAAKPTNTMKPSALRKPAGQARGHEASPLISKDSPMRPMAKLGLPKDSPIGQLLAKSSPMLGIPRDACSPSFGRSGVLSPSFSGTLMFSPMDRPPNSSKKPSKLSQLDSSFVVIDSPITAAASPIGNVFLTAATGEEVSSFKLFTEPTPRRGSPSRSKKLEMSEMRVLRGPRLELSNIPVGSPLKL